MEITLQGKTIEDRLLFTYGFVGTMPIVQIGGFTAFTWITLLVMLYHFVSSGGQFNVGKRCIPFIGITFLMLVSSIVCLLSNMDGMWKSLQIKNSVWQVCYLLIFIFYCNIDKFAKCKYYIKGVYYAAVFQIMWGIMQFAAYELFGLPINKALFYDIFHIEAASHIQTRGDSIALTGLCWNAGNIAPLVVIGYTFSKSMYLKVAFIVFSMICGSRTATLGIVACLIIEFGFVLAHRKISVRYKHAVVMALVLSIGAVFLILQGDILASIVDKMIHLIQSFSIEHLTTQSSARIHMRYWITIPEVTNWSDVVHILFGYGNGCSGYPFAQLYNQYADHTWVVECDYVNNLWNYGYVGFFTWYIWYAIQVWKSKKIDKRYWILFAGILAEGITYNVTFNWCYIMILFLFIHIMYGNSVFEIFD